MASRAEVLGDGTIRGEKPLGVPWRLEPLHAAAERLKITPTECIVLEDSEAGIHAARAAGMTPILVPDLKQPSDAVKALAYRIYPSLHEVRALFSNLFLQSRWRLTRHCSGRAHW
jgi:phosphoglycolate phosphatase-like HAD superfamily hydrolase